MKGNTLLFAGLAVLALFLLSNQADAAIIPAAVNITALAGAFQISTDQEARINALYNSIARYNLSAMQVDFMLSQLLFESGLLTDVANYNLMNQNNYAGLTKVGGGYASYPDIDTFIDAYMGFLTKGANPLGAQSLADFNNRLQQNGYYTENASVYLNGLNNYYKYLVS